MPPRGFINPAPKTESARSALSSFTCTLCNKSYSRHPEYEAHIGSYDHQHRKRLQDLKQLSRDPNAAEKARRAERKADAEAGLRVIDTPTSNAAPTGTTGGGGGFKKGGFKSSFAAVKGPAPPVMKKKNVLGDDDDDDDNEDEQAQAALKPQQKSVAPKVSVVEETRDDVESDTDEEYGRDKAGGGYYDPHRPTDCSPECRGVQGIKSTA